MWVKGSGSRPRHDGPASTSPALRLDEVLPLIERDEMSDEEMVAYLARCQLDPAMPRCSIETLLHAFVPAAHVHHTHPDGINVLAGHRRRRAARARVLRRRGGVDPVHPARLHALQAGRRGGAREPGPASSSCSPSTASSSGATAPRRRTGARSRSINRAVAFVNERTRDAQRFGGPHRGGRVDDGAPRRAARRAAARRSAARCRASARSCCSPTVAAGRSSSSPPRRPSGSSPSAPPAPTTSCTPSACRSGSRTTRPPTTPTRCARGSPSAPRRTATDYRAYVEAYGDDDDRAGRSRRARRADPAPRPRRGRHHDEGARGSRATSTTARSR